MPSKTSAWNEAVENCLAAFDAAVASAAEDSSLTVGQVLEAARAAVAGVATK